MKKIYLFLLLTFLMIESFGQVSITSTGTAFTQDFNTLVNIGTSSTLPIGWVFTETGTNANTTYAADAGGGNSGNTFSYGSTNATDRAFGGLQSGSLNPIIGVSFANNTGSTITSLVISYTGEQWRLGALNRVDRLDFTYSTDATTLTSGTYIAESSLNFIAPTTTGTTNAALNGNLIANKTLINFTISGLNITAGGTFWLKWEDLNASGTDDGLSIDDFSITASGTPALPCTEPSVVTTLSFNTPSITSNSIPLSFTPITADKYLVIRSTSNTLSTTPADGSTYALNSSIGGGTVISNGSSVNIIDNGLNASTTYYYYIFPYNDLACSGAHNYNVTSYPTPNDATTLGLPACLLPLGPSNPLSFSPPSNTSISGSFASTGASKYLTIISSSVPPLGATPIDGVVYTAGQTIGNGTVVSYNMTTNFTASGLTPATTYNLYVFAANDACTGTPPVYSSTFADGNSLTTNITTGIPVGYYNATAGLTCSALKTAVSGIITTGHTPNNYGDLDNVEMLTTDDRLNDAGNATIVWDMYSDNPNGPEPYTYTFSQAGSGASMEGQGWNKEHTFPNSWFSASSSTSNLPGADLFHIYPTDIRVNSLRGNLPFGVVSTATTTTLNGSKIGPSSISFPGYSGQVFEPIDAYKGDLARATLYMVTRYESEQPTWENLQLTGNVVMDGTTYPSVEIDYLNMLIQWHEADPVSTKEIERNNTVYAFQGNRNPFIDHPEYVSQIWSTSCGLAVPITLNYFNLKLLNNSVELNWNADNASGFSHFEIERSIDGVNFIKIGQVIYTINSDYNFEDLDFPNTRIVYYRLKMVDNNGTFKNSKIESIKINKSFLNVQVYPNPSQGLVNIKLNEKLLNNSTLLITDISGKIIKQKIVTGSSNIISIDGSELSSGRYFVKITNALQIFNQTFVIAK